MQHICEIFLLRNNEGNLKKPEENNPKKTNTFVINLILTNER